MTVQLPDTHYRIMSDEYILPNGRVITGNEARKNNWRTIMNEATEQKMPRYKCHKEVHALKIASAMKNPDDSVDLFFAPLNEEIGGESFSPINVEMPAAARFHDIDDGDWGYYVVYDDTYTSWSPTEAFRAGYTRL